MRENQILNGKSTRYSAAVVRLAEVFEVIQI